MRKGKRSRSLHIGLKEEVSIRVNAPSKGPNPNVTLLFLLASSDLTWTLPSMLFMDYLNERDLRRLSCLLTPRPPLRSYAKERRMQWETPCTPHMCRRDPLNARIRAFAGIAIRKETGKARQSNCNGVTTKKHVPPLCGTKHVGLGVDLVLFGHLFSAFVLLCSDITRKGIVS